MSMRILVTGAAGAGTSTLATAIAAAIRAQPIEADDFLWRPTSPPYQEKRPADERLLKVIQAVNANERTVLAGSIMGWGAELEDSFRYIVFLHVDTHVRLERIRAREVKRFGRVDPAFLEWAAQYETGPAEGRSLAKHLAWLAGRNCPVIKLTGVMRVEGQLAAVCAQAPDIAFQMEGGF